MTLHVLAAGLSGERVCDLEHLIGALRREAGHVTRAEAEALLALNDDPALSGDPDWDDLFIGAVAHHLVGASGHPVRPRAEALCASSGLTPVDLAPDVLGWLADQLRNRAPLGPAEWALAAFAGLDPRTLEPRTVLPM